MKKYAVTLIELVIYMFMISFIGVYLAVVVRQFMVTMDYWNIARDFSDEYNRLLKDVYSYWLNWWTLSWSSITGLVLEHWWKYLWYRCTQDWMGITYDYPSIDQIDWQSYNLDYKWFTCNGLDWWIWWSWYRLDFDFTVIDVKLDLKYYVRS